MRLELTRRTDLALRALRALAGAERTKAVDLATEIGATAAYLHHVMAALVGQGWVVTEPGPAGGYRLSIDLAELSVLAVVEAMEGSTANGICVLTGGRCGEAGGCPLHEPWSTARASLVAELGAIRLAPGATTA
jgi:Rrf2 family protein